MSKGRLLPSDGTDVSIGLVVTAALLLPWPTARAWKRSALCGSRAGRLASRTPAYTVLAAIPCTRQALTRTRTGAFEIYRNGHATSRFRTIASSGRLALTVQAHGLPVPLMQQAPAMAMARASKAKEKEKETVKAKAKARWARVPRATRALPCPCRAASPSVKMWSRSTKMEPSTLRCSAKSRARHSGMLCR